MADTGEPQVSEASGHLVIFDYSSQEKANEGLRKNVVDLDYTEGSQQMDEITEDEFFKLVKQLKMRGVTRYCVNEGPIFTTLDLIRARERETQE